MSLADTISDDLKASMKARDAVRTATLRHVLAAIKNLRVAEGHRGEVTDEEVQGLIAKEAKKRRESIQTYRDAGRDELADTEQAELEVLEGYLPEQLGEDEIRAVVEAVVAEVGAEGPGDLGKVMGPTMARLKGRADGGLVNRVVRDTLSG